MILITDPVSPLTYTSVAPPAARTSTFTSSAIDLHDYPEGVAFLLTSAAGTGTTPTLNGKIQSCATSGGTYADVSGATFTQVTDAGAAHEVINVSNRTRNRYVKFVGTIAGTTPSFTFAVSAVGQKRNE